MSRTFDASVSSPWRAEELACPGEGRGGGESAPRSSIIFSSILTPTTVIARDQRQRHGVHPLCTGPA